MSQPEEQLMKPFPRSWNLKLIVFVLVLIPVFLGLVFPFVSEKLSSPATYQSVEASSFVDQEEIERNIREGKIKVIRPGTKAILPPATWVPQTFNNCAPATTSMVLQYFGYNVDQNITKAVLRTNSDDKNVFTYEVSDYLREGYGIESKILYNGDYQTLKTLIANGFYIVVEDWLHPNEDIGHVTIIRGFDDREGVFIADDSYMGVNIVYKYSDFDPTQWKAFNREYMPVYSPNKEPLLKAIVGESWNEEEMYKNAIERNQSEVNANPADMYSWFNLGTNYFALKDYKNASEAFDKSRSLGWPKRMLWYQIQPIQVENHLGNYQKAIELANISLGGNDSFAEAHLEKAKAFKGLGNEGSARAEAQAALNYSPNLKEAKDFLSSL